MKKTILLTGAAGFIGFHLALQCQVRGDTVIGIDHFNDYYSPDLKRARRKILEKNKILIIEDDVCNTEKLLALGREYGITHCVHLAAQAGVRYSLTNPMAYVKANLEGFVSILETVRFLNIPLIYASSSSVYGVNKSIPFSEGDACDHPANLYGATKKSNELLAWSYHHLFQIPMTGLRFFTVYGPWGRPDMAYFSFTKAIHEGRPIPLFNDGHMWRDFTYIDDIVRGTISALDLSAPWEIFNLGHNKPVKILEMIHILEELTHKKAIIEPLPMQPGEIETTFANIDKSQTKLQFKPQVSIKEGLACFVDWYLTEGVKLT